MAIYSYAMNIVSESPDPIRGVIELANYCENTRNDTRTLLNLIDCVQSNGIVTENSQIVINEAFSDIWEKIKGVFKKFIGFIGSLIEKIKKFFKGIVDRIKGRNTKKKVDDLKKEQTMSLNDQEVDALRDEEFEVKPVDPNEEKLLPISDEIIDAEEIEDTPTEKKEPTEKKDKSVKRLYKVKAKDSKFKDYKVQITLHNTYNCPSYKEIKKLFDEYTKEYTESASEILYLADTTKLLASTSGSSAHKRGVKSFNNERDVYYEELKEYDEHIKKFQTELSPKSINKKFNRYRFRKNTNA